MEHSRCCTVRQYPGYEAETTSDQVIEPLPVSNLPILGQIVRQKLSEGRKKKVLLALEDAGIFTPRCLVKDNVPFCSTENGRSSFVWQLEPDWHIHTNPEVIYQLADVGIIYAAAALFNGQTMKHQLFDFYNDLPSYKKEEAEKVTDPILDALGEEYSVNWEEPFHF
ncbi:hypothetical protein SAY87_027229 [Trapa incisa]|uniref:Uncharacterized protein n=1 Tax=Trapa incisa TaxID=236973 RepID=A0AAN7GN24_9MYRT|nr:hypothetical protein SAY87_027229 [Trapa incisa]